MRCCLGSFVHIFRDGARNSLLWPVWITWAGAEHLIRILLSVACLCVAVWAKRRTISFLHTLASSVNSEVVGFYIFCVPEIGSESICSVNWLRKLWRKGIFCKSSRTKGYTRLKWLDYSLVLPSAWESDLVSWSAAFEERNVRQLVNKIMFESLIFNCSLGWVRSIHSFS